MGQVLMENPAFRGGAQQADDPNAVIGGETVTEAASVIYPYGLAVSNGGSNSYTCLPGLLFRSGLRLNAASGAALYGTAGNAYLSYNPTVSSRNTDGGLNIGKNSTSSKACTGLVHDLTLTYTAGSNYNFALPRHASTGASSVTIRLNSSYAAFPAIRRGPRIYFTIPCAWGYPFASGTKYPKGTLTYASASSVLQFYWRANGASAKNGLVNMSVPTNFSFTCEPFGISGEYRLPAEDAEQVTAGVVCADGTSNAITLTLTT